MTNDPTCRDEYERPGGRQPGDRIVHSGLPAGHLGDHREDETEATWPDQPRRPDRRSAEMEALRDRLTHVDAEKAALAREVFMLSAEVEALRDRPAGGPT